MFLPNDESELKYQESTCTLSYAAVNYTEQLVDWAIQHKLYDQPLWAWTQQHIKMVDKAAPVKSRKGRIQRITKKVPIWNHVNVPREMIDPRKQFIQNHAHLATKMGTSDIIKPPLSPFHRLGTGPSMMSSPQSEDTKVSPSRQRKE